MRACLGAGKKSAAVATSSNGDLQQAQEEISHPVQQETREDEQRYILNGINCVRVYCTIDTIGEYSIYDYCIYILNVHMYATFWAALVAQLVHSA